MKVFYSDPFELPLPEGHRFPLAKYRLLREHLQGSEFAGSLEFELGEAATDEQLLRVHTPRYLHQLRTGELTALEQRRIGFPWSAAMVERSRRSTGATLGAARAALVDGVAVHLAGGTHHAFADHGQGFCVFNDVAVAIRSLQAEGQVQRAVVVDLDVHQGNGTAAIFAEDREVFTFSIHGDRNFPFAKCNGDLDIALPDGTDDATYLAALCRVFPAQVPLENADCVFYLAGADPYAGDRYGRLKLTQAGLAARDYRILNVCRRRHLPVVVTMAGGYATELQDIVRINAATVGIAVRAAQAMGLPSEDELRQEILRLVADRGIGKTICPSEVARRLSPQADWRPLMPAIRGVALELIAAGHVVATQQQVPIDLQTVRGPYRLGQPQTTPQTI